MGQISYTLCLLFVARLQAIHLYCTMASFLYASVYCHNGADGGLQA